MTELKIINKKLDHHLSKINMEEIENKKKDILINIDKMRNKNVIIVDDIFADVNKNEPLENTTKEHMSNNNSEPLEPANINSINIPHMQYYDIDFDNNSMNSNLMYNKKGKNAITSEWTDDIEKLLYTMQDKSLELSKVHKLKYIKYQKTSDHFKIPIIILSSIATFFNFGMQPFLSQNTIAIICSSLTFITGLLGTIELYLQIQKKMEKSLTLSKDLFMNSMNIYKILSLDESRRKIEALVYMNNRYEAFRQIIEKSDIMPDNNILPPLHFFNSTYKQYNDELCSAIDEYNNHQKNINYIQEDKMQESCNICCGFYKNYV
jgi:hypothetical protein